LSFNREQVRLTGHWPINIITENVNVYCEVRTEFKHTHTHTHTHTHIHTHTHTHIYIYIYIM